MVMAVVVMQTKPKTKRKTSDEKIFNIFCFIGVCFSCSCCPEKNIIDRSGHHRLQSTGKKQAEAIAIKA